MSDPVRVGLVTPFGTRDGGAELWLLDVLDTALNPEHGFAVHAVLLADGPLRADLERRGIGTKVLPTRGSPAHIARNARPLARILTRERPDVIVANGVKAQLIVALANLRARRPSVWVKHDHSFDSWLARPLGRRATSVVATAREVGLPTRRADLIVIEPARPADPVPPDQARHRLAELGLGANRPLTLAMVSRLVPYKGVDVAIAAMSEKAAEDWQLAVIGGDDAATPGETGRLKGIAQQLGVSDRVFFLGRVPNAGRLLAGVHALAVLTRPDGRRTPGREGFGIVATEAMLAQIPVITAGAGPIAERLTTGEHSGIVIESARPDLCAEALRRLADPALRTGMGVAGRTAASGLPDKEAMAAAFAAVVRQVAASRTEPAR